MSSGSDTSSSSENTGSDKSSISENNSGKSSPTKSHSELTAKTYSHNYQNVAYEKIDEKNVIVQGKVFIRSENYTILFFILHVQVLEKMKKIRFFMLMLVNLQLRFPNQ